MVENKPANSTLNGCRYGYFSDFATLRYQIQSSNETVCQGDSIVLQTNELPGVTYTWTGPNNFTYQGSGTYTATLVGTSVFGCIDTIVKPVVILPIPESVISVVESCGQTANFSTFISSGNLNVIDYNWSVPSIL